MNEKIGLFLALCGALFLLAVWSPVYGTMIVDTPIVNTLTVFGGIVVLAVLVALPARLFRND